MKSLWSTGFVHLRPTPPSCPVLVSPADLATVETTGSITLDWDSVVDADYYRVYLNNELIATVVAPTTTYDLTSIDPNHITYAWMVRAVNEHGESSGCGFRTFTTTPVIASIQWQSDTYTGDLFDSSVVLVATRTLNSDTTVSADYAFTEITAIADYDYDDTPGTVLFNPGQVTKNVIVPITSPDYDAEMLALNPESLRLYCRMDDPSPTTSFPDLSGYGNNLILTGGSVVTYQQQDLLLDPGGSFGRNGAGTNFRLQCSLGTPATNPEIEEQDSYTSVGWGFISNDDLSVTKTVCHFGGPSGGGQLFKGWFYRQGTTGQLRVGWHGRNESFVPDGYHELAFTTMLPVEEPFWFVAGLNTATKQWFFKLNANPTEYLTYTGFMSQRQNNVTSVSFMCNQNGNNGNVLNGYGARFGWFAAALPDLDMWTRWHLGATRSFSATLSNPSADAVIGAQDTTVITLS